jgi:hypothetical protein
VSSGGVVSCLAVVNGEEEEDWKEEETEPDW